MDHKKPTERVVPTTSSARGSSSALRRYSTNNLGATVTADADECKPLTTAARESFARGPGDTPLSREAFFRLKDTLIAAVKAAYIDHWYARRAKLNKTLLGLVRLLLGHGQFALGERVAFSTAHLAKVLDCTERNVTLLIGKLQERPELVRVLRIQRGERAYDGQRSHRPHIEWELGPALRSLVVEVAGLHLLISSVETVNLNTRTRDIGIPEAVTPDPIWDPQLDLKLKGEASSEPPDDRPNFEVEASDSKPEPGLPLPTPAPDVNALPEAARSPSPALPPLAVALRSLELASASQYLPELETHGRPDRAFSPLRGKARPLSGTSSRNAPIHPLEPLVTLIRQHRQIAEHKGPWVPIAQDELDVADAAFGHLDWCRDDRERLQVCARVSELGLRDSLAKGNSRATLRYTFGRSEDPDSQKFFLERVARIREEREQLAKERRAGELASVLGLRPPVKASPPPLSRPSAKGPTAGPPISSNEPLTPSETLANIAALQARLKEPYARAG